jgi:hypothetical protein
MTEAKIKANAVLPNTKPQRKGLQAPKAFLGLWLKETLKTGSGELDYALEYAEPGYSTDKKYILLSNWNHYAMAHMCRLPWEPEYIRGEPNPKAPEANKDTIRKLKRLTTILEANAELEWSDEWFVDYNGSNPRCVRCSPNGHEWKPAYVIAEGFQSGEMTLVVDIQEDKDLQAEYLAYLLDNDETYCQVEIDLAALGFEKQKECETGWHPGQTDDPTKILKVFKEDKPDWEFIFTNYKNSQFYIEYELWGRPKKPTGD